MSKNNPELFSEVYGRYFAVVAKILTQAKNGMTKPDIESMVCTNAFYDSVLHLLPKLFSGEWPLLSQKPDGKYYSKLRSAETRRPMTSLEQSWFKALLLDPRIALFITPEERQAVGDALSGVQPLFLPDDFHVFDIAADGDPYEDEIYIRNYRQILHVCKTQTPLMIHYESGKQKRLVKHILPHRLDYSGRDDKFRLLCFLLQKNGRHKSIMINLARVRSVEPLKDSVPENRIPVQYFRKVTCAEPIVLSISNERNALERCMLQFASWEKETEYDEQSGSYTCRIYYDGQDETELLIRILSFGPVVKVIGTEGFLKQVKERVRRQFDMNAIKQVE